MGVLTGLSIDNVAILNVNSANNVDSFYPPSVYSSEEVDSCLKHPQAGSIHHYHMMSGCAVSLPTDNISLCSATDDYQNNISYYSLTIFPSLTWTPTVVGIAKDGRIIWTVRIKSPNFDTGFRYLQWNVLWFAWKLRLSFYDSIPLQYGLFWIGQLSFSRSQLYFERSIIVHDVVIHSFFFPWINSAIAAWSYTPQHRINSSPLF